MRAVDDTNDPNGDAEETCATQIMTVFDNREGDAEDTFSKRRLFGILAVLILVLANINVMVHHANTSGNGDSAEHTRNHHRVDPASKFHERLHHASTPEKFTWVMPDKRRKGPRVVSRWVAEDQPGAASTPSSKLSKCAQVKLCTRPPPPPKYPPLHPLHYLWCLVLSFLMRIFPVARHLVRYGCLQAPTISDQTRALLQTRDFGLALELAKGKTHGFLREFIHARPFENTELFDWVVTAGSLKRGQHDSDPQRILSDAHWKSMDFLVKSFGKLVDPSLKRALVFAQTDEHNSGWPVPPDQDWSIKCCQKPKIPQYKEWWCFCQESVAGTPLKIKQLQDSGKFATIAWEAMDVPQSGLRPQPIPFTAGYSQMAGGKAGENILVHAKNVSLGAKAGILAAWGTAWPKLDHMVASRINAIEWLKDNPLVRRTSIPSERYHTVLAAHRFAMCPTGGGVQSPKVFEALLLKTIPVVERKGAAAYVGLAELGYPIVVVDSWAEITERQMEKWWDEFSPMLERARWMLLTDVWYAFSTFPCPIEDIGEFLDYLSEGGG